MNYPKLAFTNNIKKLQEQYGSRKGYEKIEQFSSVHGLTPREIDIVRRRDSFYLATIGENGFPYIQHRGGPKGFIKVLDDKTLGILDFRGNKQYISLGNMQSSNKAAMILVDYPLRSRLKIYAEVEILTPDEKPELTKELQLPDYHYVPERLFIFHIQAYDWNCSQHITQRFTLEEIQEAFQDGQELQGTFK